MAGHDDAVHAVGGQFAGRSRAAGLVGGTGRSRTAPRVRTATVVEVDAPVVVVAPATVVDTPATVVVAARTVVVVAATTVVGATADGSV